MLQSTSRLCFLAVDWDSQWCAAEICQPKGLLLLEHAIGCCILCLVFDDCCSSEAAPTIIRVMMLCCRYTLPLSELGGDFYDELKSVSSGYASFDYEEAEYR